MRDENREQKLLQAIDYQKIPRHIAIIMDGNGRWAVEKGLPRKEGHRQGMETIKVIVRNCNNLRIKVLTLFAFSTENWQRPKWEVNYLMSLPEKYFSSDLPELIENNIQVKLMGDRDGLPGRVQKAILDGVEKTKENTGMILNFAMNYGSRSEILQAINNIVVDVAQNKVKSKIDENIFSSYLYTDGLPDPDLLIRTSGEFRISNFLLWQLAYSELWFTDIYWPDFNKIHLLEAIFDYQQRKRRFGKIDS
ncbi:MAG: isoprenyl transferase [Bacillota bacterium]|nr:isoprenyl transferase [Bacillota bacterium]